MFGCVGSADMGAKHDILVVLLRKILATECKTLCGKNLFRSSAWICLNNVVVDEALMSKGERRCKGEQ